MAKWVGLEGGALRRKINAFTTINKINKKDLGSLLTPSVIWGHSKKFVT